MKRLNAIDLGLSVLWADKNIYADDAMDTGEEMSVNHAFLNLIENEDSWDEWRLPTLQEIQELMSSKKTEWTRVMGNGKQTGWQVKGITGDNLGCIELPLVCHENGGPTIYWTGDRMDEEDYYCLAVSSKDVYQMPATSNEPNCVRLVRNRDIKLTSDESADVLCTVIRASNNPETTLTEQEEYVLENYNPHKNKDTSEIESALAIDHNTVVNLYITGSVKMSKFVYNRLVIEKKVALKRKTY